MTAKNFRADPRFRVVAVLAGLLTRGGVLMGGRGAGPSIHINGHEAPRLSWGRTVLPLRPGRYQVTVFVARGRNPYGPANTVVDVYPGRVVELEYCAPVVSMVQTPGSLGPPPQSYNGMAAFVACYVVPLALTVLIVLATLFMAGVLWLLTP